MLFFPTTTALCKHTTNTLFATLKIIHSFSNCLFQFLNILLHKDDIFIRWYLLKIKLFCICSRKQKQITLLISKNKNVVDFKKIIVVEGHVDFKGLTLTITAKGPKGLLLFLKLNALKF